MAATPRESAEFVVDGPSSASSVLRGGAEDSTASRERLAVTSSTDEKAAAGRIGYTIGVIVALMLVVGATAAVVRAQTLTRRFV